MADPVDVANDLAQRQRDAAIAAARAAANEAPVFTGRCLNCDKETAAPRRWCDADCRDMWEETS